LAVLYCKKLRDVMEIYWSSPNVMDKEFDVRADLAEEIPSLLVAAAFQFYM